VQLVHTTQDTDKNRESLGLKRVLAGFAPFIFQGLRPLDDRQSFFLHPLFSLFVEEGAKEGSFD
jgi:hypothetical protein